MEESKTPETINDALAQSEGDEGAVYTPVEILALDEPKHEITRSAQSESFPKIVQNFFKSENYSEKAQAKFLSYFNLDSGVYDELKNPTGMLAGWHE